MEGYGLAELAASAEAVMAGLGPLAVQLARLAGEAGRPVTLDAVELVVAGQGRELLRGLVQLALDAQADAEVRLAEVTGADGVPRRRAEPGHGRPVVTTLGEVVVRRIAYRSGVKGVPSLFPRDAVLNLPPGGYSWQLRRLAIMFCRAVAYEQGHGFVLAVTGVSVGKRQLEEIVLAAAADADPPRDPAMEDWVITQGTDILHGRVRAVITRIARLAQEHPPRPGGEHAKIIRTALHYLDAKQDLMDYPRALASGWPIATGVIEGACRHLVQDRMGITGARWGLDGAQAMLWLRAIDASGGTAAYWDWHISQEHHRNHLSRYQDSSLALAA